MCDHTKDKRSLSETWWWNKEVALAIKKKPDLYNVWKGSRVFHRCREHGGRVVYSHRGKVGSFKFGRAGLELIHGEYLRNFQEKRKSYYLNRSVQVDLIKHFPFFITFLLKF